ncbi:hypothetical protein [Leuconostoc gasicomitatum]|uniref:hypothetical protein n=1 Tax=Leuconostoc gasicomitatum TaxID=115778 RepID=UPI0015CA6FF2|nr:hypothetical protein [Leuconostoc gasicomitatum]QLG77587.1 hypothetical protein LeuG3613_01420 [Leuconostoc gasicomitatum]
MEESIKTLRKRRKHIKVATEVNKHHADVLRNKSEERKARSHIQIMGELISNKNIDYHRHMKWLVDW